MNEHDEIELLKEDLQELTAEFHSYVEQKRKEESQRLRTALMVAGGIIMTLGSFIWVEIIWPVIKAGK